MTDENRQPAADDYEEDIKDYWPIPEFKLRAIQVKALDWIQEQIKSTNAKYIIIELPVGSGKSLIGINLSKFLNKGSGNSYILTPQRILQDQYENDFECVEEGNQSRKFLASLHGKANYQCTEKKMSCNIGSITKPKCDFCPFAQAKKAARNAHNTVLNYKLALTSFRYTDTFGKRTLMIMDEAHTLERHLVDFDSVDITYPRCKTYEIDFVVQKSLDSASEWVKENYLSKIEDALKDLEAECETLKESGDLTKQEIRKITETEELAKHIADVTEMIHCTPEYLNEKFVLVFDKTTFQFKRISGAYSFHSIIKPMANKFLFMSSTILNKNTFCLDLGIDPNEASFISLPSEFDPEDRPVFYMPVTKMNASWSKPENANGRRAMLERITGLLDIHKGDSGILHTGNYQVAKWLVKELSFQTEQVIYHHNPEGDMTRKEAIGGYMESTVPAILISPSITEGLDLKDDLARFAMIVKVPFGYLGDQWIKRRMDMSEEWYRRMAIKDIIQGGGRIVRGPDDEGSVYILDACFGYLYSRSLNMVPQWWKDAYQVV